MAPNPGNRLLQVPQFKDLSRRQLRPESSRSCQRCAVEVALADRSVQQRKTTPDRLKSKVYGGVNRHVALYGAGWWPLTKEGTPSQRDGNENAAWMAGITRIDHIRSEEIRERLVTANKFRESRLWLYASCQSHRIQDRSRSWTTREGAKEAAKSSWLGALHTDLKHVGFHIGQAHDRAKWHQKTRMRIQLTDGTNAEEKNTVAKFGIVLLPLVLKTLVDK